MQNIELLPMPHRFNSGRQADVEVGTIESLTKLFGGRKVEIHDDIEIERQSWLTVAHAGERTNEHIGNAKRLGSTNRRRQQFTALHGSSSVQPLRRSPEASIPDADYECD